MNTNSPLRLGTRSSPLARWQAEWVAARCAELGHPVELVLITTSGDVKTGPLGAIGGVGLFTKELQRALLDERIDLAVHSLKDLPTDVVPGLTLAAVPEREAIGDMLLTREGLSLAQLPHGARVGTGSIRRRAQLLHHRPDLRITDIRGNVETRLRKLDEQEFEAIVLAEAGLKRLGLANPTMQLLPRAIMLPAVGQGALGIEARTADERTLAALAPLNHADSRASVLAERAMLLTLCAGCLAPVGAWGRIERGELLLMARVLSGDGRQVLEGSAGGQPAEALAIGRRLAEELLARGAGEMIRAAHA